ncbi:MAG: hypothetical protein LBJ08_06860 [Bifidobacteriaceae bacterium]|jgi:hypothetical protein|nr:hypothetical protein [Bifidobacteriaceae bacterium]
MSTHPTTPVFRSPGQTGPNADLQSPAPDQTGANAARPEPGLDQTGLTAALPNPHSRSDGPGSSTSETHSRPARMRLRGAWGTWWRSWVYLLASTLIAAAAIAYTVVALVTVAALVFAPGRYLGRAVFPVGRAMAACGLRLAAWRLNKTPRPQFPKLTRGRNTAETLATLVHSRTTWRAYGWIIASIPVLAPHLAFLIVFPLAPLWARAWAALTIKTLGMGAHRQAKKTPAPHPSARKGAASAARVAPRRGYGLLGMRERVASLGGSLRVGQTPDGGFAVHAVLPLPASDGPTTQGGNE